MCVCVYVCMYVYAYRYMHTYINTYIYIYTHTHTYVRAHTYIAYLPQFAHTYISYLPQFVDVMVTKTLLAAVVVREMQMQRIQDFSEARLHKSQNVFIGVAHVLVLVFAIS